MDSIKEHQRQKRKWQLALRRYLIEGNKSFSYARYFGLGVDNFRKWIEAQFDKSFTWENYTEKWQLDHIVPISYFELNSEEDLKLAWSFINIKPSALFPPNEMGNKMELSTAKKYFSILTEQTRNPICQRMVDKICQIESMQAIDTTKQIELLNNWKLDLEMMEAFDEHDFERINLGINIKKIVAEKEILKKRGL